MRTALGAGWHAERRCGRWGRALLVGVVLLVFLLPLVVFIVALHRVLERFSLTPSQPAT
jgi:ABC-type glycerol-3-phosphate transport system permease component